MPAVVPVLPPPPPPLPPPPPPHPDIAPTVHSSASIARVIGQRRRFDGNRNSNRQASVAPPPRAKGDAPREGILSAPLVAAVVLMLSVAWPGAPDATVTGLVAPKLSVGTSCAPVGLAVIDANRLTLPVKPFAPPTVMTSVPLAPGFSVTVAAAGLSVISGGAPTVRAIVVDSVRLPAVPVIVTVAVPIAAELLAVSVSTLEAVAGFVPKLAVTPVGSPVAESVTPLENPFAPVTLMVSVALAPWITERVPAVAASVKLGAAVTVTDTVVEAVRPPDVPVIVTVVVPVAAVLLAVSVSTLGPVAGFVPKLAVTPVGSPVAASMTLPVNPFKPLTLTVSVAVAP